MEFKETTTSAVAEDSLVTMAGIDYVMASIATDLDIIMHNERSRLVSNEALQYVFTINYSIVCAVINIFGIGANIINIIVFVKMGFKETINIALLGLSVSDLCSLIPPLWNCVFLNPLFMHSDVPVNTFEIVKLGSWTHMIFVRVASFITAYITLERCLCIVFPLKVKQILTHNRVVAVIVGIYIVIITCMTPNLATGTLVWKFVPRRNRTLLGLAFADNRVIIETYSYYLNVFLLFFSFISVTVCTSVLIWKLNQRNRWLNEATSVQDSKKGSRDRQVIQMVSRVAVIFIICLTPSIINYFAMATVPELNFGRTYENILLVIGSILNICDGFNSGVNIFIYYQMSSKYAKVFRTLFIITNKDQQ